MQPCVDELDAGLHVGPRPVVRDGAGDPAKPQATYGSELVIDHPLPHGFDLARGLRHLLRRLCSAVRVRSLLGARFFSLRSEERRVGKECSW